MFFESSTFLCFQMSDCCHHCSPISMMCRHFFLPIGPATRVTWLGFSRWGGEQGWGAAALWQAQGEAVGEIGREFGTVRTQASGGRWESAVNDF